jgi:hypothetical protein
MRGCLSFFCMDRIGCYVPERRFAVVGRNARHHGTSDVRLKLL